MTQSDERQAGDTFETIRAGELRIAKDGTWFHEGRPIRRKELVKLFSTVLKRDEDGAFWLETPVEKCPIAVEDAPFTALELEAAGTGETQRLDFRTNVDTWVEAGPEHPLRVATDPESGEPRPYIQVKGVSEGDSGGVLEALVLRPVFYQLVERAVPGEGEHEGKLGVWSRGVFFPLGPLPAEAGGA